MGDLAVLFDLDGTLTDSRAGITGSLRHALTRLGRPCPDDEVLATFIGPPLRGTLATLLDTADPELIETAVAHYRARYDEVGLFENRVYDGVPEMLEGTARLAGPLLVATAKLQRLAARIVTHFDLARHFAGVYGAEAGGRFDRKSDLVAHLLERRIIRAGRAVMVGDRASDIEAARLHGIPSVGALWGFGSARELTDAGADRLCTGPRELTACLRALVP